MASQNKWAIQRGALWMMDLQGAGAHPVAPRVRADFSEVRRESAQHLLTTVSQMDPIAPAAILNRFGIGRRCFAGWVDGSITTYGWITEGPEWVGEFERELNIVEHEAYIRNCATLPQHRKRRLFKTAKAP